MPSGKSYGADDNGWIQCHDAENLARDYPQLSRDTCARILHLIQDHPEGIMLQDEIKFAADGLMCEWAWVIDFDAGTFEAYKGFTKEPLTENDRFYFLREYEQDGYHGVRLAASFPLNALPDKKTFLAAFGESESATSSPTSCSRFSPSAHSLKSIPSSRRRLKASPQRISKA